MAVDNHVNARGNSKDRAARKKWMLSHFGNGVMANCWECRTPVDYETMVIDRIIPGKDGGRYVRGNIRPQCHSCSRIQGYEYGVGRIHKEMAGVV